MSNPFKKISENAKETKKEWDSVKTSSETKTRQCDGCGAPRPKGSNLVICDFCGGKFMDIEVEIKADK